MRPPRPPAPPMRASRALALSALVAVAAGCEDEKPFVPYGIDASVGAAPASAAVVASSAPSASAAPVASAPKPSFAPVAGKPAPPGGKSWTLEGGVTVEPPQGRSFHVGFDGDADGDGKSDLIAWVKSPDDLRGELWFVSGAKPLEGRNIVTLPGDFATRGCAVQGSVSTVGPTTLSLEVTSRCPDTGMRPARWIAIVRLADPTSPAAGGSSLPELRFEVRLLPPPAQEELSVTIDGSDVDADGRDDVTLGFTLSGALPSFSAARPTSAKLRFFDRPAGLSRDPSEPSLSLRAAASSLVAEASKKKPAFNVRDGARAIQRLHRHLCEDAGGALLSTSAGGIRCADAKAIEDATYAEAVSAIQQGNVALALDGALRLDVVTDDKSQRRKDLAKQLAKVLPSAAMKEPRRLQAVPDSGDPASAAQSPLAFENAGNLLIRTSSGVIRAAAEDLRETPAPELAPWSSTLDAEPRPDAAKATLRAVISRCEEPLLIAEVGSASDNTLAPKTVPLPLFASVNADGTPAARCENLPKVRATPIDHQGAVVTFAVGTVPIEIDTSGASPEARLAALPTSKSERRLGSARSPDGSTTALPSARGLLVISSHGAKLWTYPESTKLSGCVPNNGGTRVACVNGTAALVFDTP